jgi:hypothetical protein
VATRGALPQQAVVLAAVINMLGALLVGTPVADTIAGIVTVSGAEAIVVIGPRALAAVLGRAARRSRQASRVSRRRSRRAPIRAAGFAYPATDRLGCRSCRP